MIDPELQLDGIERAHIAAFVNTEGFKVVTKIFEVECEKFRVALINADPSKPNEVLAAHHMAKA